MNKRRWMLKYVTQIVDSKQNVAKQNKSEHQTHDRCGEMSPHDRCGEFKIYLHLSCIEI